MRRLTKFELMVLVVAVLLAPTAIIGYLAEIPMIFDLSLVVLLLLVLVSMILALVRIDRVLAGQKRAREEIYQVLYSLHGNDKWTETQARKTRDLLRDNHQALMSEVRQVVNDVALATKDRTRELSGAKHSIKNNFKGPELSGRLAAREEDLRGIVSKLSSIQSTLEGILPKMSEHYSVRAKQLVSIVDAQRQELIDIRTKADELLHTHNHLT